MTIPIKTEWVERLAALEMWGKEVARILIPEEYWPDCGKPIYYCNGCGGEGPSIGDIAHNDNCLYLQARDLGLIEEEYWTPS